jgi:hypothetical protein
MTSGSRHCASGSYRPAMYQVGDGPPLSRRRRTKAAKRHPASWSHRIPPGLQIQRGGSVSGAAAAVSGTKAGAFYEPDGKP